jgi:hypothetical protein
MVAQWPDECFPIAVTPKGIFCIGKSLFAGTSIQLCNVGSLAFIIHFYYAAKIVISFRLRLSLRNRTQIPQIAYEFYFMNFTNFHLLMQLLLPVYFSSLHGEVGWGSKDAPRVIPNAKYSSSIAYFIVFLKDNRILRVRNNRHIY